MTKNDRVFLIAFCCFVGWIITALAWSKWFQAHSLIQSLYLLLPLLAAFVVWTMRPTDLSRPLKELMKGWFNVLWSYCAVVILSSILLLVGLSAVGYLPYSDRPGPGWGNVSPHLPTLEEVSYFSDWATLLLPMCYFFASLLFAFMAWIKWLKPSIWLVRIVGGIFGSGISMLVVAAAGWHISIAALVTNSVGVCGLLFGAFILPRISPRREMPLSLVARTIGTTVACLGMSALLLYPFL